MNSIEFTKNIPPEMLARVFKDYFEQHMAAYYMLKGVDFVSINSIDMDKASIMYSVKVLDEDQKTKLVDNLKKQSSTINIYGYNVTPEVFINGDLLCLTIKKNKK